MQAVIKTRSNIEVQGYELFVWNNGQNPLLDLSKWPLGSTDSAELYSRLKHSTRVTVPSSFNLNESSIISVEALNLRVWPPKNPLSKQCLPRFLPKKLTPNFKIQVPDLSRWRVYILMHTHIFGPKLRFKNWCYIQWKNPIKFFLQRFKNKHALTKKNFFVDKNLFLFTFYGFVTFAREQFFSSTLGFVQYTCTYSIMQCDSLEYICIGTTS